MLKSLSKLTHKRWELFIISGIIHRLNNEEIEFVTQQLVRLPSGQRVLTDLYFPQFRIHLEIDEPYHNDQKENDSKRELDIINLTDHRLERIKVTDDSGNIRSLVSISNEIDQFVIKIESELSNLLKIGKFIPWDFERRYSSDLTIELGKISIAGNTIFRKQIDAMRCFGFKGTGWQRGAWKIPDSNGDFIWFPRLYETKIWHNELTPDGETIFERAINDAGKVSIGKQIKDWKNEPERKAIVFAKAEDFLGSNLLRYVGSFTVDWSKSSDDTLAFKRIAIEEVLPLP